MSTVAHLADAGLVAAVRKGLWSLERPADPIGMLEYVTAPYPAYVSLQSALYLHGMVEQLPVVTYAVTLGRSSRPRTACTAWRRSSSTAS
jgi:predicted transcriptional regulator of viral defense system